MMKLALIATLVSVAAFSQAASISKCKQEYEVVAGDSCESIAFKFGIFEGNFEDWNKKLDANFNCNDLQEDNVVCVEFPSSIEKRATKKQPRKQKKPTHPKGSKHHTTKKVSHKGNTKKPSHPKGAKHPSVEKHADKKPNHPKGAKHHTTKKVSHKGNTKKPSHPKGAKHPSVEKRADKKPNHPKGAKHHTTKKATHVKKTTGKGPKKPVKGHPTH